MAKEAPAVRCSEDAAKAVLPAFPKRLMGTQECFVVMPMDSKNRPAGRPQLVAMGTANSVEVHPRDVFRLAIKRNAVSLIVAHNHPSGDTAPSADDRDLTRRLVEAGKLLGVPVLDHLVVARDAHTSLADQGLL
jgi:DNA repair protein RadC